MIESFVSLWFKKKTVEEIKKKKIKEKLFKKKAGEQDVTQDIYQQYPDKGFEKPVDEFSHTSPFTCVHRGRILNGLYGILSFFLTWF